MNNDPRKNAEGYADPTPYKALTEPKASEVWAVNGKEYLVVQCHSGLNTVLALIDEAGSDCIEVRSRSRRYTNPSMLQYLWSNSMGEFVRKLTVAEFETVLDAVRSRFPLLSSSVSRSGDADNEQMAELKKYCDDLRMKLDVAQSRLSEAERAAIKHEMRTQIYAEMYENLLSKFIDRKGAQE